MRLVIHLMGYNLMALLTAVTAHLMPDYKNNVSKSKKAGVAAGPV